MSNFFAPLSIREKLQIQLNKALDANDALRSQLEVAHSLPTLNTAAYNSHTAKVNGFNGRINQQLEDLEEIIKLAKSLKNALNLQKGMLVEMHNELTHKYLASQEQPVHPIANAEVLEVP